MQYNTRLLFLGLAICLCEACFEPKSACLDINATNFDASADEDCCCTYPALKLTVEQYYDTLLFRNDSLYPDANGHLFRINSIVCYFSEFELTQGGSLFRVSDTLRLKTLEGADTSKTLFINDFLLLRRSSTELNVGTFSASGNFESVKFRIGLSEEANKTMPSQAPSAHPLSNQSDSLWINNAQKYVMLQVVVTPDSMSATKPDTLRFTAADIGDQFHISSGNFVHTTGYDFPLILRADFKKLFEGINWSNHDITAWKTRISANLNETFSVSQ